MANVLKSAWLSAMLLMAACPRMAHAYCDEGGASPSQLRLIDLQNWEPSMQSTLAIAGFPAMAASGNEIAILKTIDAAENSSVLDVVDTEAGKPLRRFALFPEHGGGNPHSDDARRRLVEAIVEPNEYLARGEFKPMDILFDRTQSDVTAWELEVRGVHIRYDNNESIMQITSLQNERRHIRLEWPARVLPPMGPGGMIQCGIQGIPMKGWTDSTGELIVLNIWHSGGPAHGCDEPEEWRVVRLPHP